MATTQQLPALSLLFHSNWNLYISWSVVVFWTFIVQLNRFPRKKFYPSYVFNTYTCHDLNVKLQISKSKWWFEVAGWCTLCGSVHQTTCSKSPYKPNVHISQKYCHAWLLCEQQIKQTNNGMAWLSDSPSTLYFVHNPID